MNGLAGEQVGGVGGNNVLQVARQDLVGGKDGISESASMVAVCQRYPEGWPLRRRIGES